MENVKSGEPEVIGVNGEQQSPEAPAAEPPKRPAVEMSDDDVKNLVGPLAYALTVIGLFEGSTAPDRAGFEKITGALAIKLALDIIKVMRGNDLSEDDKVKTMMRDLLRTYPLSPGHMAMLNGLEAGKELRTKIGIQGPDQSEVGHVEVRVVRKASIILAANDMPRRPR